MKKKKKQPPAVAQHPWDVSSTLDVRITATCWRLTIVKTELARSQGSSSLNPMPSPQQTVGYAKSLSLSSTHTQTPAPLHIYHRYIRSGAAQVGDCTTIPKCARRCHGDSNSRDVVVSSILRYHGEKSVSVSLWTWHGSFKWQVFWAKSQEDLCFSIPVKQSGVKWELQLPSTHIFYHPVLCSLIQVQTQSESGGCRKWRGRVTTFLKLWEWVFKSDVWKQFSQEMREEKRWHASTVKV